MSEKQNKIKGCAEKFNEKSLELARIKAGTDECIASLGNRWNDEAAAKFYMMYDDISSRMYTLMLKMSEYSEYLGTISENNSF